MALSAFDDQSHEPKPADVQGVLGRSTARWDELVTHILAEYAPMEITWGYTGARWGWSLRAKQKKRTVLYMTPCHRHFLVGLVLGEKAVPEFLQRDCTAAALTGALLPLLTDTPQRRAQVAAFARLDAVMEIGKAVPSARAAAHVLAVAGRLNQPGREPVTTAMQQE